MMMKQRDKKIFLNGKKCEKAIALNDHEDVADLQTDYTRDIISYCDHNRAPKFDLERAKAAMYKFFHDKNESMLTYCDQPFFSIFFP